MAKSKEYRLEGGPVSETEFQKLISGAKRKSGGVKWVGDKKFPIGGVIHGVLKEIRPSQDKKIDRPNLMFQVNGEDTLVGVSAYGVIFSALDKKPENYIGKTITLRKGERVKNKTRGHSDYHRWDVFVH